MPVKLSVRWTNRACVSYEAGWFIVLTPALSRRGIRSDQASPLRHLGEGSPGSLRVRGSVHLRVFTSHLIASSSLPFWAIRFIWSLSSLLTLSEGTRSNRSSLKSMPGVTMVK